MAMRHTTHRATPCGTGLKRPYAVAARRAHEDRCEILAPHGLEDLLSLVLGPAGAFADRKRTIFDDRLRKKGWLTEFPKLQLMG
jgi:hypothetical protein